MPLTVDEYLSLGYPANHPMVELARLEAYFAGPTPKLRVHKARRRPEKATSPMGLSNKPANPRES